MAELKQVNETFTLIGEAMISKDPDRYVKTQPLGKNGWMSKRLNLGIKTSETNMIYVNLEAGFWSDEVIEATKDEKGFNDRGKPKKKQNWIYNGEINEEGEYVADNIPFEDRFKEENINKIPLYKKIRVGLQPEKIKVNGDNGELVEKVKRDNNDNVIYKQQEFLFAGDAIDYIQQNLNHGDKVYVYGHTEINQYINKQGELKTIFNRVIDQIRKSNTNEENGAFGVTNFYFDKDSFDKSCFKDNKKYYIQGYRTWKNNDKKVVPVPVTYVLDFSNPNVDWENEEIKTRCEYLTNVFTEKVKKDKVYFTTWRYIPFEGAEEIELTEKDLSSDLKKRVKLGFISKEQAIKQMRGNSIGNKIKELKLVMPLGENDITLMEDYAIEDLIPPKFENKVNEVQEQIKKEQESKEQDVKENITKKFDDMFKM